MARLCVIGAALVFAVEAQAQAPSREQPLIEAPIEAQPPAPSREQLIADAQAAADRNDHDTARRLALQAAELEETPSLRLFIAQEEALSGRTAEAIVSARRCAADAGTAIRNRGTILSTCRSLERQLLRRVALVTVRVPVVDQELRVRVNGQEIDSGRWGHPLPVPPGEVVVEASAREATMRQILRIDAGEESTIELVFEGGQLRSQEHREEEAARAAAAAAQSGAGLSPFWLAAPGGAAVLFGIAAISTGAVALDRGGAYDGLIDGCRAGNEASCMNAPAVRSEGEALRDATNVLWVSAALAAAAAAVLCFFVDWNDVEALLHAWQQGEPWAALYF